MAPPTLTPAIAPSYSSTKSTKYKVIRAEFGDGYSQRVADGINSVKKMGTLVFENLAPSDADDIEDFFNDLKGADPFYYTLPLEGSPTLWITEGEVQRTYQGPNSITITAKVEQVFDLV